MNQEPLKFTPLTDRVLVQQLEAETKSTGGIVLPDGAKRRPERGKVISVGKSRLLDDGTVREMPIKKNDIVLFTDYAGTEVKMNDKEYLIMDESDILAVIEE